MPDVKPQWLMRLRQSVPEADLRFNYVVHRWEFILPSADGVHRSQFWGRFYFTKANGERQYLPPNAVTGLHDFRDLDDQAIEEACENLEHTFVANRYDGVGTTRREVLRRYRFNTALRQKRYDAAGELWADMFYDRLPRMQGNAQVSVVKDVTPRRKRGARVLGANGEPARAVAKPPVRLLGPDGQPVTVERQMAPTKRRAQCA